MGEGEKKKKGRREKRRKRRSGDQAKQAKGMETEFMYGLYVISMNFHAWLVSSGPQTWGFARVSS